jgi:hypothetical protein
MASFWVGGIGKALHQAENSHPLNTGFGIVFAMTMNLITWISRRFLNESQVSALQCYRKKS